MGLDRKSRHILILGGMGPQASVYAHLSLIRAAVENGAANNEDYPRITHLSVNVKDFLNSPDFKHDACKYLIKCLRDVNLSSIDAAFIACNTAHLLQRQLEDASGLKFTSLIDSAVDAVAADASIKSVGVLSTPSTLKNRLYSRELRKLVKVVEPTNESSTRLELIIRDVIQGGDIALNTKRLEKEIDALLERGAQRIILGCTELSLIGSYLNDDVIIDPLILTVKKVLQ